MGKSYRSGEGSSRGRRVITSLSESLVSNGVPAGNRTQIGRLGGNSFIQLNYGDTGLAWEPRRAHYNKHLLEIQTGAQMRQSGLLFTPRWPSR